MATQLAAAAAAVRPLVDGGPCAGLVIGSFARAVILGIRTPDGPRVLSLLAARAVAVPNGVMLIGDPAAFACCRPGDPATVGDGEIRVGDLRVRVVRSWECRVHRVRATADGVGSLAAAAAASPIGVPRPAVDALGGALAAGGRRQDLGAAVAGLVGLGRGLTPGGDDVLAGLMTGLHACGGATLAARIGDLALQGVSDRTTLLSADLLRLAADGQACTEALDLLRLLDRPRPVVDDSAVSRAIDRILSIGHTSGADLATGLALGLRRGLSPVAARPPARQEVR